MKNRYFFAIMMMKAGKKMVRNVSCDVATLEEANAFANWLARFAACRVKDTVWTTTVPGTREMDDSLSAAEAILAFQAGEQAKAVDASPSPLSDAGLFLECQKRGR